MNLIQKELKYRGKTETVYFRELTGGEALKLSEGTSYRGNATSGEVEVNVYANVKAGQMLVQMTLVTSDGKQVYANLKQLQEEPASKIAALRKLAQEVNKEESDDGEEEPGNG